MNEQLITSTLPLINIPPPLPHGDEVLLKFEFITVALSTLNKHIAPPPYDAATAVKLLESIVMLVELTHEMEPPYLRVIPPANVELDISELLTSMSDIAPPFE